MSSPSPRQVLLSDGVSGEVRHRRVRSGELELAVVEVGPRDGPAWLLAHGVGSSARFVVDAFAPAVGRLGGRLVTFDLRGHGSSDPAPTAASHHLDVHAGDLAAVAGSLPAPPLVLGGVSLGGHAAVRAVASGTGASAVLACLPAWSGSAVTGAGPHAMVADEVRSIGIAAVIERLRADTSMPSWLRETLVGDYSRHDPASLTAALLALDGGDAPSDHELRALGNLPLAVVGWPDDPGHPIEVARRWAQLAPRGVFGELAIGDLSDTRARLGEVAVATLASHLPASP